MRHRIFIAINLPAEVKDRLNSYQKKWAGLPCRWTKKENLHITLAFLGYVSNEELLEICQIVKDMALRHEPFSINLTELCYGPTAKMPPRMIWAKGEKSEELGKLQKDIEKSFFGSCAKSQLESKNRPYIPHITLGRIKQWRFRQIEPEERPEVNEEISMSFPVESIEVMESQLKREGAEYTILESCSLKL